MLFPCIVLLSLGVVSSQDEFQDDVNNTISNVTTAIADIEYTLSIDNETTTNTTTTTSSSENSGNMTTSKMARKIIFSIF